MGFISSACKPLSSAASAGRHGTYYVQDWLTNRSDADVVLSKVFYYRVPVRELKQLDRIIFHEFLVMEIEPFEFNGQRVRFHHAIKAQKTFDEHQGGRIEIEVVNPVELGTNLEVKHEVDMQGCGKIRMSSLLNILKDHTASYDLWKNNCWKYARDTMRTLLQRCSELPDTTAQRKQALISFLAKMRSPSSLINVFNWKTVRKVGMQILWRGADQFITALRTGCGCDEKKTIVWH